MDVNHEGGKSSPSETETLRAAKIAKERYEFRSHLYVYGVVNALFVVLWFFTGWYSGFGFGIGITENVFFWPIFPMVFWGLFLLGDYFDNYSGYRRQWIENETARILDGVSQR